MYDSIDAPDLPFVRFDPAQTKRDIGPDVKLELFAVHDIVLGDDIIHGILLPATACTDHRSKNDGLSSE